MALSKTHFVLTDRSSILLFDAEKLQEIHRIPASSFVNGCLGSTKALLYKEISHETFEFYIYDLQTFDLITKFQAQMPMEKIFIGNFNDQRIAPECFFIINSSGNFSTLHELDFSFKNTPKCVLSITKSDSNQPIVNIPSIGANNVNMIIKIGIIGRTSTGKSRYFVFSKKILFLQFFFLFKFGKSICKQNFCKSCKFDNWC